jgi:hypothetical protein
MVDGCADTAKELLILAEKVAGKEIISTPFDPNIVERRLRFVAMTEIGDNERRAREFEADSNRKGMEEVSRIDAASKERMECLRLESQERTLKQQTCSQVEQAKIPERYATLRLGCVMAAFSVVAIGCVVAIAKYPASWKELLPAGGVAEVLLLITASIGGKGRPK